MTNKKRVVAVTGTKSEYNIIYPLLKALNTSPEYSLGVVVSGAHLSEVHGLTMKMVIKDGFDVVDKVYSLHSTDQPVQRALAVSNLISGLCQSVTRLDPDILLVVGDREESIAVATVGNYCNILTCHVGGGDPVYGNSDDPIRTAVSKLAHVHFTTTENYANNLRLSGEDSWRICNIGTPGLDILLQEKYESKDQVLDKLEIPNADYLVVIKHPLSSEVEQASFQMDVTLSALEAFCFSTGMIAIILQSNNDPGSYSMKEHFESSQKSGIYFKPTQDRTTFVNLMRHAKALVGNSSMGILEAPMYGLPVINIGNRQKGRLNAGNVEFVKYDVDEIVLKIKRACFDETYRENVKKLINPYGDGYAALKFMKFLETINLTDKPWTTKKCFFPIH